MSEFDNDLNENESVTPKNEFADGTEQNINIPDTTEQPREHEVETPTVDEIASKYSVDQSPAEPEIEVNPYGAQQQYTAPQQPYNAPQQQYSAPQQPYNAPQQQYGASQQQYNAPQYGVPPYGTQQQWTPPMQTRKKKKTGRTVFCVLLAIAIVISGISIPVALFKTRGTTKEETYTNDDGVAVTENENAPTLNINQTPSGDKQVSDGTALTPAQVYKKVSDSIVAIMMYSDKSLAGEGTGIVMNEDSTHTYTYILTCAHILNTKGQTAVVQLADGTRYDAEITGFDNRTDVGILRIKAKGLTAAEFGDSDKLEVGDPIYAIGNPGGSEFFGSFTDGIVSAIGRTITSSIGYDMICIQHNAAISPGNSGGALVNEYGQVIGINSSKIAATDYEGMSFAIPITQAQEVINKVVAYGYVPGRAKLGISFTANNSSTINGIYSMAVQMKGLPSGSLVIYSIDSDSALRNTDVQAGDMIIAVNGKKMDKSDVLLEEVDKASVGDEMKLTIFRITAVGGQYKTSQFDVNVKLVEEKNTKSDTEETTTAFDMNNFFGF